MADEKQDAIASERVWAISELAEAIFLEVPAREILVTVQRTCKQWKAIVESSTPLQQALFNKPLSDIRLQYCEMWRGNDVYQQFVYEESCLISCVSINPFLHDMLDKCQWEEAAKSDPHASWRKQLLTQPPTIEMFLFGREPREHMELVGSSGNGLTMAELMGTDGGKEMPKFKIFNPALSLGRASWSELSARKMSAREMLSLMEETFVEAEKRARKVKMRF